MSLRRRAQMLLDDLLRRASADVPLRGSVELPRARRVVRNRCRCTRCGDVIESRETHEMVWCSCGAIFTDGGTEYVRRGGDLDAVDDLTELEPLH